jgi:hypothetical protein
MITSTYVRNTQKKKIKMVAKWKATKFRQQQK